MSHSPPGQCSLISAVTEEAAKVEAEMGVAKVEAEMGVAKGAAVMAEVDKVHSSKLCLHHEWRS